MSDWDNFWNDVGNAAEDAVDWVGQAAEDVAAAVVDVVEDVAAVVSEVVQDVAEVVADVAEVIADVAEDVVDWTLTVADTVIFDPVDFITGGVIDVDYEDGQLTGELNLGIASVGVSVGEQGFDAHAGFDIGIASGEIAYDSDDGLAMSGSLGVDWGPLPYAEGHLNIGTDGTVSIGGEVQATLPLPFGSVGGEVSGELYRNADGTWGATSVVDVVVDGPLDTGASFHNDASVELGPEGFSASTNTDVLIDGPRDIGASFHNDASVELGPEGFGASTNTDVLIDGPLGTGASLHNDASVKLADGDVLFDSGFEAAATGLGGTGVATDAHAGFSSVTDEAGNRRSTIEADGGMSAGDRAIDASVEVVGTRSAGGERGSSMSGDVDVTGFDDAMVGDGGLSSASSSSGASLTEVLATPPSPDPLAASVSELAGSGDLSEAISSGGTELAQVVELVEADAFDDFTSDIVSSEITESAAEEVWDDIGQ